MIYDKIQLDADEHILVKTRRHWFVLFAPLFGLVIAGAGPLILLFLAPFFTETLHVKMSDYAAHLSFLYAAWIFLLWISAFNEWTNYYLDVVTITNKRVIVINQKGFFRRVVASFRLERLQDLNAHINGFIETLLDFGELNAQTAGTDTDEFRATGMPNPRALKSVIVKAADDLMDGYRVPTQHIDAT